MTRSITPPLGVTAVMLPELDFGGQLTLCQHLGLTHYTLRPREIAAPRRGEPYSFWGNHRFDLTPRSLVDRATALRQQITTLGITPFGTVPAARSDLDDAALDLHLRGAALCGAGRVRINPRAYPQHDATFDYDALLRQVIDDYGRIAAAAARQGVKVVIETHAATLASGCALVWNIVRHFDPRQVGVILDLVNFAREGDNVPALAVAMLARHIDHIHVGGSMRVDARRGHEGRDDAGHDGAGPDERGFARWRHVFCPLRQTQTDLGAWWAALRAAGLDSLPWIIEDYTPDRDSHARLTDATAALRELFNDAQKDAQNDAQGEQSP
jgi:sugar phosphate isomerase/epimerase